MKDVQNQSDNRGVDIQKVGVKNLGNTSCHSKKR